jgi:hypothetical protein
MIYLFDDRKERQENTYQANTYLDRYSSFLKTIYKMEEVPLDQELKKASCFLLHRSFDEDLRMFNKLEYLADTKIPIVIFTNKDKLINFIDDKHLEMSAEDFYSRLKDFLQYFQEHQSVNLEILAYKNLEIEKIAQIRLMFKQEFFSKKNDERIINEDLTEDLQTKLKKLYNLLGKSEDYQNLRIAIDDGEVSKKDFFEKITKQTTK